MAFGDMLFLPGVQPQKGPYTVTPAINLQPLTTHREKTHRRPGAGASEASHPR